MCFKGRGSLKNKRIMHNSNLELEVTGIFFFFLKVYLFGRNSSCRVVKLRCVFKHGMGLRSEKETEVAWVRKCKIQ